MRNYKLLSFVIAFLSVIFLITKLFPQITSYLFVAFIITMLLKKPTNYICSWQIRGIFIPPIIAILLSYVILLSLISIFLIIILPSIAEQVNLISRINLENAIQKASVPLVYFENLIHTYFDVEDKFIQKNITSIFKRLLDDYNWGSIPKIINNIFSFTGNFFILAIAVFFISFFFLYEQNKISKKIISLIPNIYFEMFICIWKRAELLLSNYILGVIIQISMIFIVLSLGLLLIGIRYSFTIALFAALANIIPFLGPLIGFIFGTILTTSSYIGILNLNQYLWVLAQLSFVFASTQLLDNIFLQPIIFSRSIQEHPLVIFISIFIGSAISGIVGMILALPVYATLKVIYQQIMESSKKYKILHSKSFDNYLKSQSKK